MSGLGTISYSFIAPEISVNSSQSEVKDDEGNDYNQVDVAPPER